MSHNMSKSRNMSIWNPPASATLMFREVLQRLCIFAPWIQPLKSIPTFEALRNPFLLETSGIWKPKTSETEESEGFPIQSNQGAASWHRVWEGEEGFWEWYKNFKNYWNLVCFLRALREVPLKGLELEPGQDDCRWGFKSRCERGPPLVANWKFRTLQYIIVHIYLSVYLSVYLSILISSHLTSPHLISPHLISSHLTSPHLISSHLSISSIYLIYLSHLSISSIYLIYLSHLSNLSI